MDSKYTSKLVDFLEKCASDASTNCFNYTAHLHKGDNYPRVYFTFLHKRCNPKMGFFVYKVTHGIPPYSTFVYANTKVPHSCHNKLSSEY